MAAMPPDSLMSFREVIDLTQDLMEQLLTPSEFAAVEHLGSRTVLRRVANGELQCVRIGREVFIWVGEVKSTPRTEAALLRTAMVRQVSPVVRPKKAPTPPKAPSTRGTRIPDDYVPKQKSIDQIREEFPGVTDEDFKREHAKFCDFWQSKSGKDATKVNWDSTWKNWMRTADERGQLRRGRPSVNRRTNADKVQEWMDMEVSGAEGE
jgi:hypothetical protein